MHDPVHLHSNLQHLSNIFCCYRKADLRFPRRNEKKQKNQETRPHSVNDIPFILLAAIYLTFFSIAPSSRHISGLDFASTSAISSSPSTKFTKTGATIPSFSLSYILSASRTRKATSLKSKKSTKQRRIRRSRNRPF